MERNMALPEDWGVFWILLSGFCIAGFAVSVLSCIGATREGAKALGSAGSQEKQVGFFQSLDEVGAKMQMGVSSRTICGWTCGRASQGGDGIFQTACTVGVFVLGGRTNNTSLRRGITF